MPRAGSGPTASFPTKPVAASAAGRTAIAPPAAALAEPVPHSAGVRLPSTALPADACDAHMHIFDPRFAPAPHWRRTPPDAPVATYRRLQARLGTTRTVVVTPSTYGTDNACTLDALAQLGPCARGVAVVHADAPEQELDRLAVHRITGLRVNFVTPQVWGTTTPEMLDRLGRRAAERGWHLQVFAHPQQLLAMAARLDALPGPLVVDHLGLVEPARGTRDPAFVLLRRLLDAGNTWVKLSGAYMRSVDGAPGYGDIAPIARGLLDAAPERLVWGSDWPHTTQPAGTVDDADLIDQLQAWCGDAGRLRQVMVHNPARLYGFA